MASKIVSALFATLVFSIAVLAQDLSVRSPNGRAEVRVKVGKDISYSIFFDQKPIVANSEIDLTIREFKKLTDKPKVLNTQPRSANDVLKAAVAEKRAEIKDAYNELRINFEGNYSLIWRAYDNGIAYRWVTDLAGNITVDTERLDINLSKQDLLYYPEETEFFSHNERAYIKYTSSTLKKRLGSLPTLVATTAGPKLWISEADLYDYAGMWLQGNSGKGVKAVFPGYPTAENQTSDRDLRVTQRDTYIAKTAGRRTFPWRIFGLADKDIELLNNQLVYQLSESSNDDFSWVKPGKVSWDWWNAWGLTDVNFTPGINTASYKYYIDFAAKYGLEYVILDEGWSKFEDPLTLNPDVDLPELLAYAKSKNVGIILWIIWIPLDKRMEEILDKYQQWGVKGIKVDFMQRDDQKTVNFYERTAREAAKRKLLVDFHGAYKPTGLNRKYPNVVSFEGVKGLENNKINASVTPEHDLQIPFIRMVAGPMDYTPGAMLNGTKTSFAVDWKKPMSQGTRGHQLAMYVVYESPLQMLADSPSHYLKEAVSMEFLETVPTTWKETIPIDGRIGEFVVVAREAANGDWYVGGMTNWEQRAVELDLGFLPQGNFDATFYQDGKEAATDPTKIEKVMKAVTKGDKVTIQMAPGGGFALRIVKK